MIKTHLYDLLELNGISGFESEVANHIESHFRQMTEHVTRDLLDNVIATFKGKSEESVMIFAHMDEVGFMVRKIEDDGFIRFERVGGPAKNTILGSKVTLNGSLGDVIGCVGVKSYHFSEPSERGNLINQKDLWIDIGASSKAQAKEMGVNVGTPITVKNGPVDLANDLVCGKALDDRVGCAVLLELAETFARKQPEKTIHLVASVQEEFNIRGIIPVLSSINPDLAIGIDITPSCDTPDLKGYSDVKINSGVGITCLNYHGRGTLAGLITKPSVIDFLVTCATNSDAKFELEVAPGVLTETSYVQLENGGILCGSLSIPCRYTHSTSEVASLRDMESCYRILASVANSSVIPK